MTKTLEKEVKSDLPSPVEINGILANIDLEPISQQVSAQLYRLFEQQRVADVQARNETGPLYLI